MPPLKLSVILPNYNHAKYLPACLDSLIKQTRQPDEIVILDDASTDNSLQIIEDYGRRYPVIRIDRAEKNRGAVGNINTGVGLARGEYLYFCAADDIVLPDLFEKSLGLLEQHPEAGLCFSDPASFTEDEKGKRTVNSNAMGLSPVPTYFSPDELVRLSRRRRVLISGMSIFKRSTVIEAGCFLPQLKWHCDFFLNFTIAFRHGACYIPGYLNLWRVTDSSFFSGGLKKKGAQREVVNDMLDLLHSEKYRDVLQHFQKSGAMAFAPLSMFTLLRDKKYRPFLTLPFLRHAAVTDIFWNLPPPVQKMIRNLRAKIG
jgi:glycosyltransferase involved in cell wall biosynthesis